MSHGFRVSPKTLRNSQAPAFSAHYSDATRKAAMQIRGPLIVCVGSCAKLWDICFANDDGAVLFQQLDLWVVFLSYPVLVEPASLSFGVLILLFDLGSF